MIPMKAHRRQSPGFSLIEMMVSIGLLSLVVLVLFSLFNQTTKAMRANSNQTDVMEAARSGLEILSHELENMTVSGVAGAPNFVTYPTDASREVFSQSAQLLGASLVPIQQDVFFLQRTDSKRVKVVGFVVRNEDQSANRTVFPVGTLYRYEDPDPRGNSATLNPTKDANLDYLPVVTTSPDSRRLISFRMLERPKAALSDTTGEDGTIHRSSTQTNLARVADGVVSFRVTAYDQYNRPLDSTIWNYPDFESTAAELPNRPRKPPILGSFDSINLSNKFALKGSSIFIQPKRLASDSQSDSSTRFVGSIFLGEQVPTTVEIELALLEPRALDVLRSMPAGSGTLTGTSPREKYLKNNLGKIQIFRQRVPIRVATR